MFANLKTMLTVFLLLIVGDGLASEEATYKEAAVRDVFIEMLHITPPDSIPKHLTAPPKHMLELYDKYSKRRGSLAPVANTVRNILPSTEPPGLEAVTDLLFFNVSCVNTEEEVRLGQLHLNRRRLHQRHHHYHRRMLAPPYRIRLFQVIGARTMTLGSVPVSQVPRGAWQAVDITPALRELLLAPRTADILLGVKFEAPKGKTLSPRHFLRETTDDSSPAFLVIFSEDSMENEVTDEGTMPSPGPPIHTHAIVRKLQSSKHGHLFRGEDLNDEDNYPDMIPFSGNQNVILKDSHHSSSSESNTLNKDNLTTTLKPPEQFTSTLPKHNNTFYHYNRYMARQLPQEDTNLRVPRSIIDNELPDADPSPELIIPKTSPELVLKARPQTDIIPIPGNSERRGQKGRRGRRRRIKKQKNLPPPDNSWKNIYQEPGDTSGVCKVRKLTVDFGDIGWTQWIIAPLMFDANYCAGSCRFPLNEMLNPTNHAIIQTILHSMGNTPEVPAPSCVPDHLSSITVLYLDENSNVVLKNYPNMSVGSCACR